jgi:hypothetical protein
MTEPIDYLFRPFNEFQETLDKCFSFLESQREAGYAVDANANCPSDECTQKARTERRDWKTSKVVF